MFDNDVTQEEMVKWIDKWKDDSDLPHTDELVAEEKVAYKAILARIREGVKVPCSECGKSLSQASAQLVCQNIDCKNYGLTVAWITYIKPTPQEDEAFPHLSERKKGTTRLVYDRDRKTIVKKPTPQSGDAPQKLRSLVNEQAEDDGLWFITETASEAYLQQELRKLHKLIEEVIK